MRARGRIRLARALARSEADPWPLPSRAQTTNDKVRTKVLGLIRKWNEVFKEGDEGEIMHELYDRLSKSTLSGSRSAARAL